MIISYQVEVEEEFYEGADPVRKALDQTIQDFLRQEPRNSKVETPFEIAEE